MAADVAAPAAGAASPARRAAAAEMQRLRHGPILPTRLRLAAPSVLAMVLTVLVGIAETYYVGRLGTTPLAAMASVLRGTGNMRVPSITIVVGALLQIALGGLLGLGAGPLPSFGMVGVAVGHLVAAGTMVAVFAWFLASGRARVQPRWRWRRRGLRWQRALLADILRVGALATCRARAASRGPRARCRR
jgi:Na+-driven multidrug efflux pump